MLVSIPGICQENQFSLLKMFILYSYFFYEIEVVTYATKKTSPDFVSKKTF